MTLDPVRRCELFKHLDDEQFAQIAPRLKYFNADANDILYAEGEPADTVSIVIEGSLHALKTSMIHDGKTVLCEFGPSDIPVCTPTSVSSRNVSSTLPSGMMPMTFPWASQSRARWMAVRSGCPRQTGMML